MNTSRFTDDRIDAIEQDHIAAWRYRRRPQPPRYDFAGITLVCWLIFMVGGAGAWLYMAFQPIFVQVQRIMSR